MSRLEVGRLGMANKKLFADAGSVAACPDGVSTALALSDRSLAAEEFRLLAAKIRALNEDMPPRCLGMVSAVAGEGKSTLVLGLMTALAGDPDRRTLLIEADLRRPSLERYLGIPRTPGLAEWLDGSSDTLPVRRLDPMGFHLVSAGLVPLRRPELLGGPRMQGLIQQVRSQFDYVLVDCPPLTPVADAVIFQDLVDGFLFVVRARHAPREAIQRAVARLKPGRVAGLIFNDQKELLRSYYTYGYRYYGEP
jgi:capsular exopolysaccharide synthesis family protein